MNKTAQEAYLAGRQAAMEKLAQEGGQPPTAQVPTPKKALKKKPLSWIKRPAARDPVWEEIQAENRAREARRNRQYVSTMNRYTAVPTEQDKRNLTSYGESVDAGVPNARIGNVPVYRSNSQIPKLEMLHSHKKYPKSRYRQGQLDRQMDKVLQTPFVAHPHSHAPGVRTFMNLPQGSRMANNKITRAHEYYHAAKPGGAQMNRRNVATEENENMADLYAGLTDFDLRDVADFYLGMKAERGGGPITNPQTHDDDISHFDDQSRLRLFAGMAR